METTDAVNSLWEACLSEIEQSVSAADFKTWFLPLRPVSFNDNVFVLWVPSSYYAENLERRFLAQFESAFVKVFGPDAKLGYKYPVVDTSTTQKAVATGRADLGGGWTPTPKSDPYVEIGVRGPMADPQLNPAFTFDTYVLGESNRMAASVGMAVAQKPGKTVFNPLFVYGGPGVGKTHLVQAIGIKAKQSDSNLTVAYLSADRFMRQYQDAKVANAISGFMRYYQGINLLILDDVQELSGRTGTADIFFQIFSHLLQNGRQVILASDKKPGDLSGLPERLLSRFKSGMVAEVCEPDSETRLGIVRAKAGSEGLNLSDDVAQYVANCVCGNAREIQGALVSLLAYATMSHTDVTLELAHSVVGKLASRPKQTVITREAIIAAVCDYYKLELDSIKQNTRKREVALARQIAMYLCHKLTTDSLKSIGSSLGGRNHSTVVYACQCVSNLIDSDKNVAEAVEAIESNIKSA